MPKKPAKLANPPEPSKRNGVNSYGLTPLQLRFVEAYLGEASGTPWKAAEIAGCKCTSRASLATAASRLMREDSVQAFLKNACEKSILSAEQVLAKLTDVVNCSVADFYEYDPVTKKSTFNMEKAKKSGYLSLIQSFEIDGDRVKIKLPSKLEALALMAKYHGLLIEKIQVVQAPDVEAIRAQLIEKLERAVASQKPLALDAPSKASSGHARHSG